MTQRLPTLLAGLLLAAWLAAEEPAFRPPAYHPTFSAAERQQAHVQGRSHDLRFWPYLDGQWLGIVVDAAGKVWFSVSTHSGTQHAQVFCYDPATDKVLHVADLGQATGEKLTGNPPQDKIHGQLFADGDEILGGTCEGHVLPGRPYQGGYWLAINRQTGVVRNLVSKPASNGLRCSISRDGLLAVGYDAPRKLLYGHTNRTGELLRFNPATGEEAVLGIPWQDTIDAWRADTSKTKPKEIWPRGLTLMITPDGRVFGAKPPGCTFWEYNPATGKLANAAVTVPLPAEVAAGDAKALERWQRSALHLSLWDAQEQCFLVMRSYDEMLCRFYPPKEGQPGRLEPLQAMGFEQHRFGQRLPSCTLVLHGRTVYYTPYTGWGGVASLRSYDLATRKYTDHGPIVVEGDRRVNECHSLAVGADGRLYLVAFVFSLEGRDPVNEWGMRDKYPFHPRLVIIDPAKDSRPAQPQP